LEVSISGSILKEAELRRLKMTRFLKQVGDELLFYCPWCPERIGSVDETGNLQINEQKGLWNCWRCSAGGRLEGGARYFPSVEPKGEVEALPDTVVKLNNLKLCKKVSDFFEERKIVPGGFAWVDMEDENPVFPIFFAGELVGWQKRYIDNKFYYTAKNFSKSKYLYNYDFVKTRSVLLMEGPLDCLKHKDIGVGTLGTSLTRVQISLLKKFSQVFIAFDVDAFQMSRKELKKLIFDGISGFAVKLTKYNSPSWYSHEELFEQPVFDVFDIELGKLREVCTDRRMLNG